MSGAAYHAGRSKQDYATPPECLAWFEGLYGRIVADLAAHADNAVADLYFDEAADSLAQDWAALVAELGPSEWLWLNPPFARIAPWAAKCAASVARKPGGFTDRGIALLVPASVGANWWAEHVDGKADVKFLRPRMSFDGIGPFPKDIALCFYHAGALPGRYACITWKETKWSS